MADLLKDSEIDDRLRERPEWRRDGDAIVRDREVEDFAAAIAWVNAIADEAERRNHHPDLLVHGWNHVRLTVTNHSAGGLTAADFELAAAIDALPGG